MVYSLAMVSADPWPLVTGNITNEHNFMVYFVKGTFIIGSSLIIKKRVGLKISLTERYINESKRI